MKAIWLLTIKFLGLALAKRLMVGAVFSDFKIWPSYPLTINHLAGI